MNEVRWGFVGTGTIAAALADALSHVSDARPLAVASRTQASADTFAKIWGFERAYGSYANLFADPDVDVVYIATPTGLHREQTLAALKAGKHVLCEKALTANLADTKEVLAAAQASDRFLMEALWTVFFPAFSRARAVVDAGEIGKLSHVEANFNVEITPEKSAHRHDPAMGGGATLDLGIYTITAALTFAGPVRDIDAEVTWSDTGIDERVKVRSRHTNGVTSELTHSFGPTKPFSLELIGSKGRLLIENNFFFPDTLKIETDEDSRTETLPFLGNGYVHELQEVHRCLSEGRQQSPIWPHKMTLACAEFMEQILRR